MRGTSFVLASIILALPVAAASTAPALSSEHYCFDSNDARGETISLEFRSFYDPVVRWRGGYIVHKGQASPVTLAEVFRVTTENPSGKPWEFQTRYVEIIRGVARGAYTLITQGGRIYRFTYHSPRGEETEFVEVACSP